MAEVQAIAFLGTQRSRILPTDSHSRLVGRSARYLVKRYVMNRLYFGDNLKRLSGRLEFPAASVDLVYLDPPFDSNADYNVLFREPSGQVSQAQFHAFTDTWSWADAAETYHHFIDNCKNVSVVELMEAFHTFLKNSPMMAYLAMMAPRLVELNRVLKENGSLYLHCDPTASHYLKLLLDGIFWREDISKRNYLETDHFAQ